jgi:YD repeat-containing protein
MNRFEQAVQDCMIPTARLLDQTTNPLHRAILLNFWRHVHLEGSGQYERIVAPDMMVDRPVYRVTWGANPAVIEGKAGVVAFYNAVGESVLWHSDDRLSVADWGVCDEITFHQLARGADLRAVGYDVPDPDKLYHAASRQAFIWPYDDQGRLIGEHLYEDKTSLVIEEIDPAEAITPARVREIHREGLARLEAGRAEGFWMLGRE